MLWYFYILINILFNHFYNKPRRIHSVRNQYLTKQSKQSNNKTMPWPFFFLMQLSKWSHENILLAHYILMAFHVCYIHYFVLDKFDLFITLILMHVGEHAWLLSVTVFFFFLIVLTPVLCTGHKIFKKWIQILMKYRK